MPTRLDLEEAHHYGYVIGWWDEENDILGDLRLGEDIPPFEGDTEAQREREEHLYISQHVLNFCPPDHVGCYSDDRGVMYWENTTKATKALRAARAFQKEFQNTKRPWPEWALTAASYGWKPPKKWKP